MKNSLRQKLTAHRAIHDHFLRGRKWPLLFAVRVDGRYPRYNKLYYPNLQKKKREKIMINSLVEKAKCFAHAAHSNQMYGPYSYTKHLFDVVRVLDNHDMKNDYIIAAAWLHDVLEDTNTTFEELMIDYGRNIARLVYAVTDEPGENRAERHARTHPKILAAGREATAIKLADRIANATFSKEHNHSMLAMYQSEYPVFKQKLRIPGELKTLWASLDLLMMSEIE